MIEQLFCGNQILNEEAVAEVMQRQFELVKGEGALGRLEEIVMRLASHQGAGLPEINKPWLTLFASDHGVFAAEVSEYDQDLAEQTVKNFCEGSAAVNVLANFSQVETEVVDIGVKADLSQHPKLINAKVAQGTANFMQDAAMTESQLIQALETGVAAAERAKQSGADIFIGGEVGAANTTSALAMIAVLSGKPVAELVGYGDKFVSRCQKKKAEQIDQAIALHQVELTSPLKVLQYLGGFETVALCGAYIRCAQLGLSVVVDGLMATVAVWIGDMVSRNDNLVECQSVEQLMELGKYSVPETMFCLCGTCPRLVDWCFFAHQSAETVHEFVLDILAAEPLLKLELRQGEGTGGVLVLPIIQQACLLHSQTAKKQLSE